VHLKIFSFEHIQNCLDLKEWKSSGSHFQCLIDTVSHKSYISSWVPQWV